MLKVGVALTDTVAIASALLVAYGIRFDLSIPSFYLAQLKSFFPIVVLIRLATLYYSRSYRFLWQYAGINDLLSVLRASIAGLMALAVVNYFRNYPLGLMVAVLLAGSALAHRGFLLLQPQLKHIRAQAIVIVAVGTSIGLLTLGVVAYSVVRSAPIDIGELPFGQYLMPFEFQRSLGMPRGVLVMETILSFILVCAVRIAPRLLAEMRGRWRGRNRKRTLIFGAGDAGEMVVRGLRKAHRGDHLPVGFVDDDPAKQRMSIHGVNVLGTRERLASLIDSERIEALLVAVQSVSDEDLRELAAVCLQKGVVVRRVPSFSSMGGLASRLQNLETVDIEELIGRPEVQLDPEQVRSYLHKRVVLVTGAGGSIGAELCRQIVRFGPKKLIVLGKGENSIYTIMGELQQHTPDVETVSVIGDIGSSSKIEHVFGLYRPHVVFHAAAHKHLPFMEKNPEESVFNNIFGTRNVAEAAWRHVCERFVMVSTDKAVNPTSVMGATKRVAELVLQGLAKNGDTRFVTVRFGNVLRSRGSVLPLFEKQIAAGGPVTVTDAEMTRYFMSIPEAVRLTLHSGAIGESGDLCILDMGKQVRILDLAENMIRKAGKVPYEDIKIEITGTRTGEKLFEELFTEEEARSLRKIDKIFVSHPAATGESVNGLEKLRDAAIRCDHTLIVASLREIVPSFTPTPGRPNNAEPAGTEREETESPRMVSE